MFSTTISSYLKNPALSSWPHVLPKPHLRSEAENVLDEALHSVPKGSPSDSNMEPELKTTVCSVPSFITVKASLHTPELSPLCFYLQPFSLFTGSATQQLLIHPLQGGSSCVRNTGHQHESKWCFLASWRLLSERSDTATMGCPQIQKAKQAHLKQNKEEYLCAFEAWTYFSYKILKA